VWFPGVGRRVFLTMMYVGFSVTALLLSPHHLSDLLVNAPQPNVSPFVAGVVGLLAAVVSGFMMQTVQTVLTKRKKLKNASVIA